MQLLGELTTKGRGADSQTLKRPTWMNQRSWLMDTNNTGQGRNPGGQSLGIRVAIETVSKCSDHHVQD